MKALKPQTSVHSILPRKAEDQDKFHNAWSHILCEHGIKKENL